MSFKNLPQIEKILNLECFKGCIRDVLLQISRDILDEQRQLILQNKESLTKDQIIQNITEAYNKFENTRYQKVINATGVTMHTNLGRSVIDDEIINRAKESITSYSNLEFSLSTGSRADRYTYVSKLLCALFGTQDALVVNNNASAVFLMLNTFCKSKECIVSRGELVEIGGSFRVPDVMANSGAILKEVGTTNKTKISDYKNAINENTNMLFKAHRSNFDMVGFTQSVDSQSLHELAKQHNIIDYYDLGSGYATDLNHGLTKEEPSIQKIVKNGVSLISFSGDKLLGSAQCGIILGSKELISKLRQNQLLRMLRVDKIILAILCESIKAYLNKETALITTINLINKSNDELLNLANLINKNLKKPVEIITTQTYVGGGSLPNRQIPTIALCLKGNPQKNELKFRSKNVIGRIENDKFVLDLRSILDKDIDTLINIINELENE